MFITIGCLIGISLILLSLPLYLNRNLKHLCIPYIKDKDVSYPFEIVSLINNIPSVNNPKENRIYLTKDLEKVGIYIEWIYISNIKQFKKIGNIIVNQNL